MSNARRIVETVPNFSEGRDLAKVEKIADAFRGKEGVILLDVQTDADHNRCVISVAGDPDSVKKAVIEAIGTATRIIDMNEHRGQHPRMGATDVVPFIPIRNVTMEEAVTLSREVAGEAARAFDLPVFLYEASASRPERKNLADIRKGQFEGMAQKIALPEWKPDYGPARIHPTAGVTAIGARMPLVAYNVNLDTNDIEIANKIARKVRHINGGLRYCRAMGVELKQRGIVQVSMNLTDFTGTSIYAAFEMVRMEARRYGVNVVGSEVIGMIPMQALIDSAVYYLGIEEFNMDQVLESKLME